MLTMGFSVVLFSFHNFILFLTKHKHAQIYSTIMIQLTISTSAKSNYPRASGKSFCSSRAVSAQRKENREIACKHNDKSRTLRD
jgi:hypothetical protein